MLSFLRQFLGTAVDRQVQGLLNGSLKGVLVFLHRVWGSLCVDISIRQVLG